MSSVLFVCLGNICRSPTAEGVFRSFLRQAGLAETIRVDSAGTGAWHMGEPPDIRAQDAAALRGYELSAIKSRRVRTEDFFEFDYVLAMDWSNLQELRSLQPDDSSSTVSLFLDYAPAAPTDEVPDPYYGSGEGFETVLDLVEQASVGLLKELQTKLEKP
ncbi:MAG: low molecular weight protein-tyrosine-phosphatase [Pseudomonadota bacterium]